MAVVLGEVVPAEACGIRPAQQREALLVEAVERETERLRLGLLVACLPLHHPIRLVEEICMLDQLSGGRVDLGVGRGISPFEHRLFGHDPGLSRERFAEILPMVVQGLSTGRMDSAGFEHFDFPEVELPVEPVQRPYPPLWAAGGGAPHRRGDAGGAGGGQPLTALGGAWMPVSTRCVIRIWLPESSRIAASMP